jgi:hypothetical protein
LDARIVQESIFEACMATSASLSPNALHHDFTQRFSALAQAVRNALAIANDNNALGRRPMLLGLGPMQFPQTATPGSPVEIA